MLCLMALFLCGIVLFVSLIALRLRLPASGHVDRLVAAYPDSAGDCGSEVLELGVHLVSRSGLVLTRVWKRLRQVGFPGISMP